MTPFLSRARIGLVVSRRAHGGRWRARWRRCGRRHGRRRARSLGLAGAPLDPCLHAELRQGLVVGAETDQREGAELPGRLAPVFDHLLDLLRRSLSLAFERLLLDLELPDL